MAKTRSFKELVQRQVADDKGFAEALLRPIMLAAVMGAGLSLVAQRHPPTTWPRMFAYGSTFTIAYFAVALVILGGYDHLRGYLVHRPVPRCNHRAHTDRLFNDITGAGLLFEFVVLQYF